MDNVQYNAFAQAVTMTHDNVQTFKLLIGPIGSLYVRKKLQGEGAAREFELRQQLFECRHLLYLMKIATGFTLALDILIWPKARSRWANMLNYGADSTSGIYVVGE